MMAVLGSPRVITIQKKNPNPGTIRSGSTRFSCSRNSEDVELADGSKIHGNKPYEGAEHNDLGGHFVADEKRTYKGQRAEDQYVPDRSIRRGM